MTSGRTIFSVLFLAVFATTMGAGIVAPLLPVYADRIGAGAFEIGLIFGAFSLTRTLFVPYFGRLSDRIGRKLLLTSGLMLYAFLSVLYAASATVEVLILLRLGQGFASAMILPVAQAYVGMIAPAFKEGRVMGLFSMSLYGGLSFGPLIGGLLSDFYTMKIPFLSMGGLAMVGFLMCLFFLPSDFPQKTAAKPHVGPAKQKTYRELLGMPPVRAIFIFRFCFTSCVGVTWAFLPLLADELRLSSSATGMVVMINVAITGILQAPMGYLADRFSKKTLIVVGGIMAFISVLFLKEATTLPGLFIANAVFGAGGGLSFPAIMAIGVIEGKRSAAMGSIMGLLAFAHSLGMLAGPLVGGALMDFSSMKAVFTCAAGSVCLGTLLCLKVHPRKEITNGNN
ncbi:MAG: MFS transporter [Desulfobacteraceae bacterium]|jgi:MFS family permease|nr:MAG: MFS transporter [Desulfobacteraceae bacterium]